MFLFLLLFLHINRFIVTEQSHTFWILKGKMINIFEPFHSFISVQSSVNKNYNSIKFKLK